MVVWLGVVFYVSLCILYRTLRLAVFLVHLVEISKSKKLPSGFVDVWLGLTGELDPESSECFIAKSLGLGNWGEELAVFEDCFGADSNVVCIAVSNV